jgi:hypothetical protein
MTLLFILLWQGAWWGAVLLTAHPPQMAAPLGPWLGLLTALPALAVAFWMTARQRGATGILSLVFAAMLGLGMGLVVDGALLLSGVAAPLASTATVIPNAPWISPPWMWGLWLCMAVAMPLTLGWLVARPKWMAAFGFLGAPGAYGGGVQLGALQAPLGLEPLLILSAILYAIALPLLAFAIRPHAAKKANS